MVVRAVSQMIGTCQRSAVLAVLFLGGAGHFVAQAEVAPSASASGIASADALGALVGAARGQVGQTRLYDPAYVRLDFPGGDVARDRGVCTDVVIRALRDGLGVDLQRAVNRDMKANFASYPQNWGLKRPDPNIDHRRVPNLQKLLTRAEAKLPEGADYLAGDLVSSMLPGNLPHIMIVSDRAGTEGPLVIHNIGRGAREEDALLRYPITGHYRLTPEVLAKLRKLDQ